MNGTLWLNVMTALNGNHFLSSGDPGDFSDTLMYVGDISFLAADRAEAKNFPGWFASLGNTAKAFSLVRTQAPRSGARSWETVGFVGGGNRWFVAVHSRDHTELWESFWSSREEHKTDLAGPWRIEFRQVAKYEAFIPEGLSLAAASARLSAAIEAAIAFALEEPALDHFRTGPLQMAIDILDGKHPPSRQGNYKIPAYLDDPSARVLGAARDAFVFGAMGSWNDYGPSAERQEAYIKITGDLYEAVCDALLAVVNANAAERLETRMLQ